MMSCRQKWIKLNQGLLNYGQINYRIQSHSNLFFLTLIGYTSQEFISITIAKQLAIGNEVNVVETSNLNTLVVDLIYKRRRHSDG